MQEKLIIYFNSDSAESPRFAVMTPAAPAVMTWQNELAHLAEIAANKEIIVLVPGQEVLLLNVAMPKMSRSRLQQALPYVLEEQVIDEIENLHFAFGDYQADGSVPVAIVARHKMEAWMQHLQSFGLKADVLLPDVLAVPYSPEHWTVIVQERMSLVRNHLFKGFACDTLNLPAFLGLAMQENAELKLKIENYTQQSVLPVGHHDNETFLLAQSLEQCFAEGLQALPPFNLLQDAFAVAKRKLPPLKKIARLVVYLGSAWLALLFLNPVVSYFLLHYKDSQLEAGMLQVYQKNFPQATSLVTAQKRMEEKLKQLLKQNNQNHLLVLLAYVAEDLKQVPSVQLKRFNFQHEQLSLELVAASSEEIGLFTDFLQQQGLTVKQQNAEFVADKMHATLTVT